MSRSLESQVNPGRYIAMAFGSAIAVGTYLLSLPISSASGRSAPFIDALFTATSAVCQVGLVSVDTGAYWSGFGHTVILILIQLGGIGIMAFSALIALMLFRRVRTSTRTIIQAETKAVSTSNVRDISIRIAVFSFAVEAVLMLILFIRFRWGHGMGGGEAAYSSLFHSISAFNNAGFALSPDSLMPFAADPWIVLSMCLVTLIGGFGFPVIFELAREWRTPHTWSGLLRVTLIMSGALLLLGTVLIWVYEYQNPNTLAGMSLGQQVQSAFATATFPRSAGFNVIQTSAMEDEGLFITMLMMFIGAGSGGTGGGIKVTTFAVILLVVWAEIRGSESVNLGRRRIPLSNQRQALSIMTGFFLLIIGGTVLLLAVSPQPLDDVLFEAISAGTTTGLSTGITGDLNFAGKMIVILMMFIGRLGPLTFVSALAANRNIERTRRPEERLMIG